jgi:hypothetical protein
MVGDDSSGTCIGGSEENPQFVSALEPLTPGRLKN